MQGIETQNPGSEPISVKESANVAESAKVYGFLLTRLKLNLINEY